MLEIAGILLWSGLIMARCVLLTSTPSCVVSPRGQTTREGLDVNNTHLAMINSISKSGPHCVFSRGVQPTTWIYRRSDLDTQIVAQELLLDILWTIGVVAKLWCFSFLQVCQRTCIYEFLSICTLHITCKRTHRLMTPKSIPHMSHKIVSANPAARTRKLRHHPE